MGKDKNYFPQAFQDFYRAFPTVWGDKNDSLLGGEFNQGLSVWEKDNDVFVEASLPGIPTESIRLYVESDYLFIEGEKKEEKEERTYHKKSSSFFKYKTKLPTGLDENKEPEATYKDGVLTVKFSKHSESKKSIPIKSL